MSYDPFERGSHPVGVRTIEVEGASRAERHLPVEVWYPATAAHAGRDLDPDARDVYPLIAGATAWQSAVRDAEPQVGCYPLVVFSHGFAGHRRQTSFLCTHLASHGYVVAAPDHVGNTMDDLMRAVLGGTTDALYSDLQFLLEARPADVSDVIDRVLRDDFDLASSIDADRIGMTGHSFGGWTSLTATAREQRIRAVFALAPAGRSTTIPGDILGEALDLDWKREVPLLLLVADRDSLLDLAGMHAVYREAAEPKRMVILRNADHFHFCDNVKGSHEMFRSLPKGAGLLSVVDQLPPIGELCPPAHGHTSTTGLGLAHFDAILNDRAEARAWLDELEVRLRARDLDVEVA